MRVILNDLTLKLLQRTRRADDDFLLPIIDRGLQIPREWTDLQRSMLAGCGRRRLRKVAKWLGVTLVRGRRLSVAGSFRANHLAIEDIYGYRFDDMVANPFCVWDQRTMNAATVNKLVDHFRAKTWSWPVVSAWVETHAKGGEHLIESWRCLFDGDLLTIYSTLRLVVCKKHRSCKNGWVGPLPWIRGGKYHIAGWPQYVPGRTRWNESEGGSYGGWQKT